jgi:hypothetical protein
MSKSTTLTQLTTEAEESTDRLESVVFDEAELASLQDELAELKPEASSETFEKLRQALLQAMSSDTGIVVVLGAGASRLAAQPSWSQLEALLAPMLPALEVPSEAAVLQARRNAEARAELLQEFGALTGEQIAEERSRAENRHALAARWRKEGRIFGVDYRGQILYPAFQFHEDLTPRGVVREALTALPRDRMSEWEIALWWTAANRSLAGVRPVDLLDSDPEAITNAAASLREPSPL